MKKFIFKWLPRIFGCHQNPNRSFFIHGEQFPICARCTGELIGILMTPFLYWKVKGMPICALVIMMIPLIIDGVVQAKTKYESNNIKRLLTGVLFGIGLTTLFMLSTEYCFCIGLHYGKLIK